MYRNKVIWITGASSGIGEALALNFAGRGARLALSARRERELERVAARCVAAGSSEGNVLLLPLDVTNYAAMPAALERVMSAFGQVDMLVNNAGISQRSRFMDTEMAVYRKLMEVDFLGQVALTKIVLPVMLKQADGHLVVTSSIAGKLGAPTRTGYCAAKHAVMGFFDSLRAEIAESGVMVSTITPGFIKTHISVHALEGDGSEFGKTDNDIAGGMDADACAEVIVRGLSKGKPEIAVGQGKEMHALWIKRLFPGLLFWIAAKLAHRAQ